MNSNEKSKNKGRQQEYALLKVSYDDKEECATSNDVLVCLKNVKQPQNNPLRFCLKNEDEKTKETYNKTWSYFVGSCVKKRHRGPKIEGERPPVEKNEDGDDSQGSRFFVISNEEKKLCIFAHSVSYGDVKSNINTLLKPLKFNNLKETPITKKITEIKEIQSIRIAFNSKELLELKEHEGIKRTNLRILKTPIFTAPIERKLWFEKSLSTECIGRSLQELLKRYLHTNTLHSPENLIKFLNSGGHPTDLKLRRIEETVLLALCLGKADYFRIKGRHNVANLGKNDTLILINGQLHAPTHTLTLINQLVEEVENLKIAV